MMENIKNYAYEKSSRISTVMSEYASHLFFYGEIIWEYRRKRSTEP